MGDRYRFNYPYLTDTIAMTDIMQITPSGYEDVDRRFDESTGRMIADLLNSVEADAMLRARLRSNS